MNEPTAITALIGAVIWIVTVIGFLWLADQRKKELKSAIAAAYNQGVCDGWDERDAMQRSYDIRSTPNYPRPLAVMRQETPEKHHEAASVGAA